MIGAGLHIHLDPVGGLAGDMFIAAILDALPDLAPRVLSEIASVVPGEHARAALHRGKSRGMSVLRFDVAVSQTTAGAPAPEAAQAHGHDHHHDHHHGDGHHHGHAQHHDHDHHTGAGRVEDFRALARRIDAAPIAAETRRHALGILTRIAEAEARMHAVPLDDVHFHELADWDSLADVVGAGAILGALTGTGWSLGPLPLGGGLVTTAHGRLAVPAPATTALLEGIEVCDDGIGGERVTPTGAAIAAHLHDGLLRPRPARAVIAGQGMGAGTRDLPDRPNILRAILLRPVDAAQAARRRPTRHKAGQ